MNILYTKVNNVKKNMENIKVFAGWIDVKTEIGTLSYEKVRQSEIYCFEYSDEWLSSKDSLSIDNELPLVKGRIFSQNGIFKCFSDSLPDRWGKKLIEIKNYQISKAHTRITSWDYLKAVEDSLRSGALKFGSSSKFKVPLLSDLHKIFEITKTVENSSRSHSFPTQPIDDSFLKAASAVGGARPKACVKDGDILYIAKFPSISDDIDKGKWEHFAHRMAAECGIAVADTEIVETKDGDSILLSKRFDRDGDRRIHMASSMSLLGFADGTDGSSGKGYLDIVEFIVGNCMDAEKNLEELYRRVAFGICIGNCDDHFRNHSFLLTDKGWTLSPAYDLNPSFERHHAILINEDTDESDLDILLDSHECYMIDKSVAIGIVSDVVRSMKYWEKVAKQCGLSRAEMKYFSDRFAEGVKCSLGNGIRHCY